AFDEATSLALDIVQALTHADQLAAAGGFAGELAEHTPPTHPNRAPLVDMEARSLIALGFTDRGLACYRRLVADFETRCQAEPQRADYQRGLSVSYNKLGDLMKALGNGDDAQRYFLQALNIAEKLARAEPQRADYQRDLSVSYNKLGDLMKALGNGDDAQRYYLQAILIAHQKTPDTTPHTVSQRHHSD
ncbi:MAG: tetratricopeptide repeat protein, partial [Zoogloea sp.]|nr:tetratricopeptide repeat protein [Zoogloea sp.]